jgi:hypothetical protein
MLKFTNLDFYPHIPWAYLILQSIIGSKKWMVMVTKHPGGSSSYCWEQQNASERDKRGYKIEVDGGS